MTAASEGRTINLSLVSHTNVGKTTLMRTLLRREVGEVADRPHVTEIAEGHELLVTPSGDVLRLWDTPGFGDSARLMKRLAMSANPIGWILTQVWDRFVDRPFFSSQQAVRNVRDESDVVLYLVNAAEDPASAHYVEPEMRILGWIGKPVLVLLNQTGPARGEAADRADEMAWSRHLATHVPSHRVTTLDAFARCWVQEDKLLASVAEILPEEKRPALERLRQAWRSRNLEVFQRSMEALAAQLATAATDREIIQGEDTQGAMKRLASRLDAAVRENTDRLIALHGLSGRAAKGILARMAGEFAVTKPADVRKTGLIGGVVSGALGGLAADLSAAGMTFGLGALIGGILGAIGAGGAAQAYNMVRGVEEGHVRWSPEFLSQRPAAALLRYLAVAHYGRGRGDWAESEYPRHWHAVVEDIVRARQGEFDAAWAIAEHGAADAHLGAHLEGILSACAREVLVRLYPDARDIWSAT